MKLSEKTAIITGANQGFGLAVAEAFVREGANVMLAARQLTLLEQARDTLAVFAQRPGQIAIAAMDISQVSEVDALVQQTLSLYGAIDVLVANAGIYGPKGPLDEIDWDDWSTAIDINLKGTALMCRAVMPRMKQQRAGKIILLSGGGATKPMPNLSAYAVSKAAVVRLGDTLAEELQDYGVDVNSIAPGALNTRLLEEILQAGPEKVGEAFYRQSLIQKEQGGAPLEKGASLAVFLASAASDGISGKLISALWDPWADLPQYLADLKNTDIYTLRRIVPQDRHKDWG